MSALHVFDAYGTLFDVHAAVARHRDAIGPQADRLSELWRGKQLEYSWIRALCGAHRDFWTLTCEALDWAIERLDGAGAGQRAELLDAWRTLEAYGDARPALTRLRAAGGRCAILSNGAPDMLADAVRAAGMAELLDAVISIEEAGVFKTDPRAYRLVTGRFSCAPGDVTFVSSNRWDVAGATCFGFSCAWINRARQPDEYRDLPPARVLSSLAGL